MIVEQSYQSLIQGVSQQHPNQRQMGQVSELVNMCCDAVTGLRRRRGFEFIHSLAELQYIAPEDLYVQYHEFSGATYIVVIDTSLGILYLFSHAGQHIYTSAPVDYLRGLPTNIKAATVSGYLGLLNTTKVPVFQEAPATYLNEGFLYVFAGDTLTDMHANFMVYKYSRTGNTVSCEMHVAYMIVHLGDGTSSGTATRWSGLMQSYTLSETIDTTYEAAWDKLEARRVSIVNQSYRTTEAATYRTDIVPNTPTEGDDQRSYWFGHKLSHAFTVTATGLLYGFLYPLLRAADTEAYFKAIRDVLNYDVLGSGVHFWVSPPWQIDIRSTSSTKNIVSSGASDNPRVPTKELLPPRLSTVGNGFVVAVGASEESSVYWQWQSSTSSWVEAPRRGYKSSLSNMPVMLSVVADDDTLAAYLESYTNPDVPVDFRRFSVQLDTAAFKGRLAGNAVNNPEPEFTGLRLTGIGGYQGRLVLLQDNRVFMSRANRYNEFMRSTVQHVDSTDPISLGNVNITGAHFKQCVEYRRDLLVIADNAQASIPYSNALSPSTASLVLSSKASVQADIPVLYSGGEVYYADYNSQGYVQVGSLLPDSVSEHLYTPEVLNLHIPEYYPAPLKSWAYHSSAGMLVASNATNELLVQFSLREGNSLLQNAWCKWVLPYSVVRVWFSEDTLYCLMHTRKADKHMYILASLQVTRGYTETPMLDLHTRYVNKGVLDEALPAHKGLQMQYINTRSELHMSRVDFTPNNLEVTSDWQAYTDYIYMGLGFASSVVLEQPVLKQDKFVYQAESSTAKWLALHCQVRNSGAFKYNVVTPYNITPYYKVLTNPAGYQGYAVLQHSAEVPLHVRASAVGTRVNIVADELTDLNIVGATAALKFSSRRKLFR